MRINSATPWCSGVEGVRGLIMHWGVGDTILADWAIGSVSRSLVKRNGNGYLNDQQCLEG